MIVRLGYVATTLNIKDCSPSKAMTFKTYSKISNDNSRLYRLKQITKQNLDNTKRILYYNKVNNIMLYRLTSKLVPLATHPDVQSWNFTEEFKKEFHEIGELILENNFRISAHPDHFTLINSISKKVIKNSLIDLDYHAKIFEALGLDESYKLVIHVGGAYNNKIKAVKTFEKNFHLLPDRIKKRIILENDDKIYNAEDVLKICQDNNIPMVLDVHHFKCIPNSKKLEVLLPDIFATWNDEKFVPKVHFSSPKDQKRFRYHADDINIDDFINFINIASELNQDIDVMLEAKNKDVALLKLSKQLESVDNIEKLNTASFKINY